MAGQSTASANSTPSSTPVWRTCIDLPLMGTPALARVGSAMVAAFGTGGRRASRGGLLVLDADTGKIIWQFDAASAVEGGAAVDGSRAYFGDQLGRMRCLDLATQREVWQITLEGAIVAAPLLAREQLFVGTTVGIVACLDAATGRVIHASKVKSQLVSVQPIHVVQEPRPQRVYLHELRESIAKAFSLAEIRELCDDLSIEYEELGGDNTRSAKAKELVDYFHRRGLLDELVSQCEKKRPRLTWRATPKPTPEQPRSDISPARQSARITSTPLALSPGTMVAGALDGGLYRLSIDSAQPELACLFDAGAALYAAPIADRGAANGAQVILMTYRGDVFSIDARSGHEIWHASVGKPIRETPSVADGVVVFGTQGRTLHALDLTDGHERWRLDWRNSITTTPLVSQGRVLFGDTQGRIVCVNEATRVVIWEFETQVDRAGPNGVNAAVFGGFATHAGRVLCGAFNGCAYAFHLDTQ